MKDKSHLAADPESGRRRVASRSHPRFPSPRRWLRLPLALLIMFVAGVIPARSIAASGQRQSTTPTSTDPPSTDPPTTEPTAPPTTPTSTTTDPTSTEPTTPTSTTPASTTPTPTTPTPPPAPPLPRVPTPPPPATLALESWHKIDGALPPGFHYHYGPHVFGWPVTLSGVPLIRGGFLDPREVAGYHFGIDINVNDDQPEWGAPLGASHRVYAREGGVVISSHAEIFPSVACDTSRLELGHFLYWHIMATVRAGQHVRPGQMIGWTCRNEWHIHLSEWQMLGGKRVWVNPLHRDGLLRPYHNSDSPQVSQLELVRPANKRWCPQGSLESPDGTQPLDALELQGLVELRADVVAPQSSSGAAAGHPDWRAPTGPYRLAVVLRNSSGRAVFAFTSFRNQQMPDAPFFVRYAPGTRQNLALLGCTLGHTPCSGNYWYRPFSLTSERALNTRTLANGRYRLSVYAWSLEGDRGERSAELTIANTSRSGGPRFVAAVAPCLTRDEQRHAIQRARRRKHLLAHRGRLGGA
jgi:hypothetical protein